MRLAALLAPGDWLALEGGLGAGKTTLAGGIAHGLGYTLPVRSPTFVLMSLYSTEPPLLHADFYRLETLAEAEALGLAEMAEETGATVAVEWASRFPSILPARHLAIHLCETDAGRSAILTSHGGALSDRWSEVLRL